MVIERDQEKRDETWRTIGTQSYMCQQDDECEFKWVPIGEEELKDFLVYYRSLSRTEVSGNALGTITDAIGIGVGFPWPYIPPSPSIVIWYENFDWIEFEIVENWKTEFESDCNEDNLGSIDILQRIVTTQYIYGEWTYLD